MIKIRNVSHKIEGKQILQDISLDIPTGGISALIGPNGAGKSTLFSLVARLQDLETGSVMVEDMDVSKAPSSKVALELAILTQYQNIHSHLTVEDLLMFGRYPHHKGRIREEDKKVVAEITQIFGLNDLKNRYLNTLSGGQCQRALIAMTFCQDTSHVLLDEPLNNLDMYHAKELMKLLKDFTLKKNLTTVMIVHDINMATVYAQNIIALKDGKVLFQGDPNEVVTKENLKNLFDMEVDLLEHKGKKILAPYF